MFFSSVLMLSFFTGGLAVRRCYSYIFGGDGSKFFMSEKM
jgi:hypothetical protein